MHRLRLPPHGRVRIVSALLVAVTAVLGPIGAIPAAGFDEAGVDTVTVYQPGGLEPEVIAAALEAAGRSGASWARVHSGTIQLLRVARGGMVVQAAPPGLRIPMSTMALDAERAEAVIGRASANALARGQVVMGETSAALRGARAGDVIEFVGWDGSIQQRRIGLVAPDPRVNWAELVFDTADAASFGFERVSSIVLWDLNHRDQAIIELWRTLPEVRLRLDSSDDPWHADSVLPTVLVKQQFGEFAYRERGGGDEIIVDAEWRNEHIVDVDLPLLGPFRCHRQIVPRLEGVIQEVIEAGLAADVSFADFQLAGGCWNPRLIRGGDKGGAVSRHTWGIAIDLNPSDNPYGGLVNMPEEIAEIFRARGFAWGGGWTFPDGAHFEWNRADGEPVGSRRGD